MTLVTEQDGTIQKDHCREQYNAKFHTPPAESLTLVPEVSKQSIFGYVC